jgi:hypothetical protein
LPGGGAAGQLLFNTESRQRRTRTVIVWCNRSTCVFFIETHHHNSSHVFNGFGLFDHSGIRLRLRCSDFDPGSTVIRCPYVPKSAAHSPLSPECPHKRCFYPPAMRRCTRNTGEVVLRRCDLSVESFLELDFDSSAHLQIERVRDRSGGGRSLITALYIDKRTQ